jgi:hypothetical protein
MAKSAAQLALENSIKTKLASTLANLKAMYDQQTREAEQQKGTAISNMEQSVQTDALRRSMARSSLPVTMGRDNLANIEQAFVNAAANRQIAYNTSVADAQNQANADLAQIALQFMNRGGGGGGRRQNTPPNNPPVNNPTVASASPAGSSKSLAQAVATGVVPLEAAVAYTGAARPSSIGNVKPSASKTENPYEWWKRNH